MKFRLLVEPEADFEITEAAEWYAKHNPALCVEFLRAVDRSMDAVVDNPLQYQIAFGRVRRVLIGRFPYMLMYTVADTDVVVAACMHGRRNPKRWQSRFSE